MGLPGQSLPDEIVRAVGRGGEPIEPFEAELASIRLVFGQGELARLGQLAGDLGCTRVMIVTDAGIRDAGHVARAAAALSDASVKPFVYDGVEENPSTRHVQEALDLARADGIDGIVGLGGGSAMDCAKGLNFLLTNGGRMEDYWGTGKATREMLPSIGVPTTAGTGSEGQSYALIVQEQTRVKMACGDRKASFRTVILDPALVVSVPPAVAAATGIDAVSHAVESYVSRRRTPISMMLSREAWRLLEANLAAALADPSRPDVWGAMLIGAHLAGAAIEQSMLGAAHACANPLTARCDVTHGIAVGLMLPHVMDFNGLEVGNLYEELLLAGAADPGCGSLRDRVRALCASAGLPERLRDLSVPRELLPGLAEEADRQWTGGFNPRAVTAKELLEFYEAAY